MFRAKCFIRGEYAQVKNLKCRHDEDLSCRIFQANEQEDYISIDSGIKFLCACFVIRDATPRILPREKRRGEDSREGSRSVFFAPKTKAKVNRSRRNFGYGTIDQPTLFIRWWIEYF